MKTLIVTLFAVASLVLAGMAFAGSDSANPSPCGAAHGAFADVNGSFGWLGPMGGTPGYHGGAVGQDPGATGYNNSHTDCND
jgi:hypothetical protein